MISDIFEILKVKVATPTGEIWFDVGIIIIIATVFALIARLLKQPLIPAYIIGGVIIGPIGLGLIKSNEVITVLSEIGIAFLLFFAGLEISFKKLKDVTKVSTVAGLAQVFTVGIIASIIALIFSFSKPEIIFLALAIPFSSTAIVAKILADRNELNTLHARIAIGMLLLQDIIAIIALTVLSTKTLSIEAMLGPLLKVIILVLFAFLLSKTILKPIFSFAASSVELLFLTAIAICFLFSLLALLPIAGLPNLSIVIGSFIAGVLLANSPFKIEIESKVLPLRDFFVTIFFVSIGMQLVLSGISKQILPLICFMATVVFIEPYISMIFVRLFGYTKKTSFFAGFFQGQTSEFSLILMAQGLALGHVTKSSFSMIVLITVITMSMTPFFIANEHFFFSKFSKVLNILKRLPVKEKVEYITKNKKKIVLFGCHRMGSVFLKAFSKVKDSVIVVDINPEITKKLTKQNISNIYGDIADPDIINKINFKDIKLAISTVPEKSDNLFLIERIKEANPDALIFVTSDHISEALELYKKGADYVILPQVLGGERGLSFLKSIIKEKKQITKAKEDHIKYLQDLRSFI